MNGVSLLVALTMLGVDVGWEAGLGGRLVYTIRIESLLMEPLRQGQPVVSAVGANDRALRRFQIIVGPNSSNPAADPRRDETLAARAREGTMVQFGWRPSEEGGLEYLVQITPERLETLASGIPIAGDIPPEVPEIRRFLIFVGVNQLPRVGLPQPNPNEPPQFLPLDNRQPAASVSPQFDPTRVAQPPVSSSDPRAIGAQIPNLPNNRDYGRDGGWQSGGSTPSLTAGWQGSVDGRVTAPAGVSDNRWPQYTARDAAAAMPISNRDDRAPAYGYGQPAASHPGFDSPGLGTQPVASYAQRPVSQPAAPPEPAAAAPAPPASGTWPTSPASAAPASWNASSSMAARSLDDSVRPWTPLILTTLALFASLGANAYLGWLAWSFFWRYRDVASDLARARTLASASRQAA